MKLVYLSPVPWASITQRPHFFASAAIECGFQEILWVNPYPSRFVNTSDLIPGRHKPEPCGLKMPTQMNVLTPGLFVPCEPFNSLFSFINFFSIKHLIEKINKFATDDTVLVIGKPCLIYAKIAKMRTWQRIIYDAMDNYPSFYRGLSKRNIEKVETELVNTVDMILCSSHALLDKFKYDEKCQLIQNACSNSMQPVKTLRDHDVFTFGYIGTIANWFDWQWVAELALINPHSIVKLIGPVKTLIPAGLPANVLVEEPIAHSKVMETIASFDVALIPFVNNAVTDYVDPVKFYEYSLAEKTILTTAFGEMLWHAQELNLDDNPTIDFAVPVNTLIFPKNNVPVPRWADRFNEILNQICAGK